ncbi:MAG: hypothetical protein ACXAAO_04275 [Candidatus Thorarchaeota archaeon]|jgi:hypothetical protein
MGSSSRYVKGMIGHAALFFANFAVLVGIIESLKLFTDPALQPLPILNLLLLGYMLVHTFTFLSIQLGVQILELIKMRFPTFLLLYYFLISDQETISVPLFDPTKSRLSVFILILVITGAPVLYPIFAVYGYLVVSDYLAIIALDPTTLLGYFGEFLNYVPPLMILIAGIIILSILMIERKHV